MDSKSSAVRDHDKSTTIAHFLTELTAHEVEVTFAKYHLRGFYSSLDGGQQREMCEEIQKLRQTLHLSKTQHDDLSILSLLEKCGIQTCSYAIELLVVILRGKCVLFAPAKMSSMYCSIYSCSQFLCVFVNKS